MTILKKLITCIMVMALTVTILNVSVSEQTSVQVAAKNKYTGAVTLSNKEKREFQKIINKTAKKKIAKLYEQQFDNKYTAYSRYAIVRVVDKNVLILGGDFLGGGSGNEYLLYYVKDGRIISNRTGGSRYSLSGFNKKDGSLYMSRAMYPHPYSSIKIDGNRLKEYNILDSGDIIIEDLDKAHCNFNGKKITVKKYEKLMAKLYSDVYDIKYVNLRKNKKIKKNCQFVTKNKY